jgi:L-malate glycosyltransferase
MRAIHQFTAGFTRGDAISNAALVLRDSFRGWGYAADIFSERNRIMPELRAETRDAASYATVCDPDDLVLLHLSIGSPVNEIFAKLPCRKAILYHNITPAHYFKTINPRTAAMLDRGRAQVEALAGVAALTLAVSRFNARELEAVGYRDVRVLPLLLDFDALNTGADKATVAAMRDGKTNILFVGRCVPNKRIEDVLAVFAHYQHTVNPNSRLIHVGAWEGAERYHTLLKAQVQEYGLHAVLFTNAVPQPVLNAYYATAHAFLCMSEHEGFCIPLLESMAHGLPVLAYDAGAVAETLDGAGVLLQSRRFNMAAEMLHRLAHDEPVRRAVLAAQARRLARYRARDLATELRGHLAPLLGIGG